MLTGGLRPRWTARGTEGRPLARRRLLWLLGSGGAAGRLAAGAPRSTVGSPGIGAAREPRPPRRKPPAASFADPLLGLAPEPASSVAAALKGA